MRFNQVDPFEDTESSRCDNEGAVLCSFNQVDPFEDTESTSTKLQSESLSKVSTKSIRLRILKGIYPNQGRKYFYCFNQVDPFEDTERWLAMNVNS